MSLRGLLQETVVLHPELVERAISMRLLRHGVYTERSERVPRNDILFSLTLLVMTTFSATYILQLINITEVKDA